MQIILLSYSRLGKVVEEYAPLKERLSSWNSIITSDNEKEYNDNSGASATVMYERVLAFMNADFTTLVNNAEKMYSTLEFAKERTAGLLCACETFPDILKGGPIESPLYWQSRNAAPSLDILYFDDEDCKKDDYSGTIKDQTDNVEECCKVLPEEIAALRVSLGKVETVNVNVESNIAVVEECITKEMYTKTLYTAMTLYVAGIKGLEAVVIDSLSPLIDEEAKKFHMRDYDYTGETTDNFAFIKRALYKDMGYTDEEIDAILGTNDEGRGIRTGIKGSGFVTITDLPYNNYGGSQMWYQQTDWYWDLENRTRGNGCGVIAAVNMYLYMTGQTEVTQAEFKALVDEYFNAGDYDGENFVVRGATSGARKAAVKGFTGATPEQIEDFIERMCAKYPDKPVTVQVEWDWGKGMEDDYETMKANLSNDTPVVWAWFDWNNGVFGGNEKLQLYYYYDYTGQYEKQNYKDPNTGEQKDRGCSPSHYVTVTAIYEVVNDDGSVRRMIEVSTWGEKVYVDYDEYIALCGQDVDNIPFSSVTNTAIGH